MADTTKIPNLEEHEDPYTLYCPACESDFLVDEDDDFCWADDVRDECTTACPGCGAALCVVARREVWFSSALAEEPTE